MAIPGTSAHVTDGLEPWRTSASSAGKRVGETPCSRLPPWREAWLPMAAPGRQAGLMSADRAEIAVLVHANN